MARPVAVGRRQLWRSAAGLLTTLALTCSAVVAGAQLRWALPASATPKTTGAPLGAARRASDAAPAAAPGPKPFLASMPPGVETLDAVTCASPYWCAVVFGSYVKNSKTPALAFAVTIDGGQSWYENLVVPAGTAAATVGSARITAVACPTVENCVLVGYSLLQQPLAYVTSNAGRIWRKSFMPPGLGAGDVLTGVACATYRGCTAVGSLGEPLLSSDAGLHWKLGKRYPVALRQVWGISCPESFDCIGLEGTGNPNVLLRSGDGGSTWKVSGGIDSGAPFALSCPAVSYCVAMGSSSVYVSTNGGTSWSAGVLNKKNDSGFESVTCASPQLCMAVGTSDAAGYPQTVSTFSLDGGRRWY